MSFDLSDICACIQRWMHRTPHINPPNLDWMLNLMCLMITTLENNKWLLLSKFEFNIDHIICMFNVYNVEIYVSKRCIKNCSKLLKWLKVKQLYTEFHFALKMIIKNIFDNNERPNNQQTYPINSIITIEVLLYVLFTVCT